ncbi:GNAT family N-acetyltransferase [Paenibacillus sp. HB172176]|uniref:GNAT family N-acetyltransferase n=1 Tax=Paenibacillus sp. HB172176 TaxID=2493690 RepID=UPI00143965EC|nr:GNAT family N-acetyltransferase [Paenibacillus sp. HB172176]
MIVEQLEEKHLAGMAQLWNKELSESFPMRLRLLRQNVIEDRLWLRSGSWVVREEETGGIVGFVVAKKASMESACHGIHPELGWIQALLVASEKRGQGIGGSLLKEAEDALRTAGAKQIMLGNDLHSRLFPGIPDELEETKLWFEKRGYDFIENTFDMLNSYGQDEHVGLPDVFEAKLRVAKESDREGLISFVSECFPGTWDYQVRDYWERGGTGREFVVLEKQGAIIGFCRMNDGQSPLLAQNIYWSPLFEEPLGGIGPLGIDVRYRGHQYGISIVQAAIHFLRERGMRHIVIDTTPFVDFYGKLGYKVWKGYAKFDKGFD